MLLQGRQQHQHRHRPSTGRPTLEAIARTARQRTRSAANVRAGRRCRLARTAADTPLTPVAAAP